MKKKTIHTKVTYLNNLISIFNTIMLPLIFSKDVALIVNDATLRHDGTPFKEHYNIYDKKIPILSDKTNKIKN